jgi:heme A synthase
LQSEIVTLHLATGSLFFLTILFTTLRARHNLKNPQAVKVKSTNSLYRWGKASLALVYAQIILGGVVSSHYAGLACPDFPTCLGHWWPNSTTDSNVHIQFAHRLGASAVFCTVLYFALKSILSSAHPKSLRIKGGLVLLALVGQVTLGISSVIFRLPVALSVAHLAIAECLIALVLISTYEIRYLQLR